MEEKVKGCRSRVQFANIAGICQLAFYRKAIKRHFHILRGFGPEAKLPRVSRRFVEGVLGNLLSKRAGTAAWLRVARRCAGFSRPQLEPGGESPGGSSFLGILPKLSDLGWFCIGAAHWWAQSACGPSFRRGSRQVNAPCVDW